MKSLFFRCIPLLVVAVSLAVAGCGKRWGELERLDLGTPRADMRELHTPSALLANMERLNTYDAYEDGRLTGQLTRTVLPWEGGAGMWRNSENDGSFVELVEVEGGLAITTAHNKSYDSWIVFNEPLVFAPRVMELEETYTFDGTFTTWAKGWSRRQGSIKVTSQYLGLEDVVVPLGLVRDCARVDAEFNVRLPFAFNITMTQRQWLHPTLGEVIRDIDGSFGWAGVGVRSFTRRYVLVEGGIEG